MKTKEFFLSIAAFMMLVCVLAACGSDNDEPKDEYDNNDNKEHVIPEGLVSEEEFHRIVEDKVWLFDKDYESVYVKANGEEYPELDYPTAGTSFCGFSFKDGKKASMIWPPFTKVPYSDYRYEETTGAIYGSYNPEEPAYIVESITEDRMIIRDRLDEVPAGIGKDPATWSEADRELEKGSYRRSAMRVADEEEAAYYREHYVEE